MGFIIKYALKIAVQLGITAFLGWAANKVIKKKPADPTPQNVQKLPEKDIYDEKVT